MLRLGYKASSEQFGPTELLNFGVKAEEHRLLSECIHELVGSRLEGVCVCVFWLRARV